MCSTGESYVDKVPIYVRLPDYNYTTKILGQYVFKDDIFPISHTHDS